LLHGSGYGPPSCGPKEEKEIHDNQSIIIEKDSDKVYISIHASPDCTPFLFQITQSSTMKNAGATNVKYQQLHALLRMSIAI
jgi:hypothetical protein